MTAIQGFPPTNAASAKPGQASSADPQATDTFGVSMLMAMLMPPAAQSVSPQEVQVTSGPITDLPTQQKNADTPNAIVGEVTTASPQEADGTSTRPIENSRGSAPVPKTVEGPGTPLQTARQATPQMKQSVPNSTAPAHLPSSDGSTSAASPERLATATVPSPATNSAASTRAAVPLPDATPVAGPDDAPVRHVPTKAVGNGRVPATPDATRAAGIGDVPATSEAATPANRPNVSVPPQMLPSQEGESPIQITVESSEISSSGTEANTGTPRPQHAAPEAAARARVQTEAQTPPPPPPHVGTEAEVHSSASKPTTTVGLAQDEVQSSVQRNPVEGQTAQTLDDDAVPENARSTFGNSSRESLPDDSDDSPQRQAPRRVATNQPGGRHGRERLTVRAVDGNAAAADTPEEITRTDRMERQSVEGVRDEKDQDGFGRVRTTVAGRFNTSGATSPVAGPGSSGGAERLTGQRVDQSRVDQSILKAPVEEPSFVPKAEDRVTLKFTDDAGVEGRLRVAVRGQSVRATIVADDPAVAERFNSGVSEIQRSLGNKGFQEAQINVQAARTPDEPGGLTIASATRNGAESVTGSTAGRTHEDQAHRERQHNGPRDQQQRNDGRSQQRSRERQER